MSIHSSRCRVALALLLLAVGSASWAADPLGLEEAQRIAVGRSQQLVAQDALALAAREQAVAAGQLPDPVLRLGIDNLPADGPDRGSLGRDFMTMRRIGIMQELPRAEKRQLRAQRLEREAQRAQAGRLQALAAVQQGTALAWLERHYSQAMRELLERQLAETGLQVQAADSAFRTGRGSQADVFAARAAVLGLQDRLIQNERQSRGAMLMLVRWVGAEAAERPSGEPPGWQNLPAQDSFSSERIRQHPDLLVIGAEIDAAETDARLALANRQSDWSVEASYSQRGPGYSNMVSVGVSIPLQWDQKNRQNRDLAASLARGEEAKARHEDLLRSRQAEAGSLLNDWQVGKQRLARHQGELIPVLRQRAEAALVAYRNGKGDLAGTLAARRDEIDAQMQALSLEMETARAWAQLNFLIPEQPAMPDAREQP
ncbi:MAG: outer rane efflux protein [Polaromonas sp.]|nr:outer rane efflux protein [Polaromonas sp.]